MTVDSNNGRITPTPFTGNVTFNSLNLRNGQTRTSMFHCAIRLAWVSSTPFGGPVVPEV